MQPEASPELPAPAAARHELGTYLRAQRVRRRINIARAAAHVGIAPGTLSRIETAYAPVRTAYLYLLLDLYRITDDTRRRELADLARQGQCQPYWAEHDDLIPEGTAHYLALEASTAVIRTYAPQLIPDQLMTAGYAVVAARATRPDLGRRREDKVAALARARCDQITRSQCRVHALINMSTLHRITDLVAAGGAIARRSARDGVDLGIVRVQRPRPVTPVARPHLPFRSLATNAC
jgi:transcriptional regulator with XRE-family HTH domain